MSTKFKELHSWKLDIPLQLVKPFEGFTYLLIIHIYIKGTNTVYRKIEIIPKQDNIYSLDCSNHLIHS